MSNPIEELGKTMAAQMQHVMHANSGITLELGTIGNNMSLKVASLGNAIPKGDYMVSLHLKMASSQLNTNAVELTTNETLSHQHTIEGHKHTATLPGQLRGLQGGDRVLVAWVGTEPVVVDIVVSS